MRTLAGLATGLFLAPMTLLALITLLSGDEGSLPYVIGFGLATWAGWHIWNIDERDPGHNHET